MQVMSRPRKAKGRLVLRQGDLEINWRELVGALPSLRRRGTYPAFAGSSKFPSPC